MQPTTSVGMVRCHYWGAWSTRWLQWHCDQKMPTKEKSRKPQQQCAACVSSIKAATHPHIVTRPQQLSPSQSATHASPTPHTRDFIFFNTTSCHGLYFTILPSFEMEDATIRLPYSMARCETIIRGKNYNSKPARLFLGADS